MGAMPTGYRAEFAVFRRELLLAPRQVRVRLLERIEQVLAEIAPEKTYPFDYIVYRVTDHRGDKATPIILAADEATVELARTLDEVGRSVAVDAESIAERVLTVEELTVRWKVSPATVLGLRRAGLALRLFRFGRGRRKAGVRESLVAKFESERGRLIRRARTRRHLGERERRRILEEALLGLLRDETPARIIADISERFTLRPETVQRLICAAARSSAAYKPLTRAGVSRRESQSIVRDVAEGAGLDEVARRYGRTVESVRRVLLRARARKLFARPLKVTVSAEFDAPGAGEMILGAASEAPAAGGAGVPADELPVFLKGAAGAPLLTRQEEIALFRKYNYLKFLASKVLKALDLHRPDETSVERAEALLADADRARERLIRSNLRLVPAIAKRHYSGKTNFASLVSDGNMALMDAIETFDYTRGNRFSTYAGWAIIRRFARTVPEENYRVMNVDEEMLEAAAKVEVDYAAPKTAEVAAGISRALAALPERERAVLESRFGIGRRAKPATLAELGDVFGVTKERVRQIEAQALARLRRLVEATAPELIPT